MLQYTPRTGWATARPHQPVRCGQCGAPLGPGSPLDTVRAEVVQPGGQRETVSYHLRCYLAAREA